MSVSAVAYWPGDTNPATFQTLSYVPSTNTLSITPFGNSVVLNPQTQSVSTINASTINTSNIFVNITNSSTINSYVENTTTLNASTVNVANTFNASNANISSINGLPVGNTPTTNWLDPYGSGFVVSTTGTLTPVYVAGISTLAGHAYLVNIEYAASNTGGGGANDLSYLSIANANNTGGTYGKTTFLDSWQVSQTYDERYNSACGVFTTLANNTQNAAIIQVGNNVATGNTQNISIFNISTKDLGVPTTSYIV